MKVTRAHLFRLRVPFREAFVSAQGARCHMDRCVVELSTDEGLVGLGETVGGNAVFRFAGALAERALGQNPLDRGRLKTALTTVAGESTGFDARVAHAGLEMACWDIAGKAAHQPLWRLLGDGPRREQVPVACCLGAVPVSTLPSATDIGAYLGRLGNVPRYIEHVRSYVDRFGFKHFKIKNTGTNSDWEIALAHSWREQFGDTVDLRIDWNAVYSPAHALSVCRRLERYTLEFYEDPTFGLHGMARLRNALTTPLATNMCVTEIDHLAPAITLGAVDIVLGDPYMWGGLSGLRALIPTCRALGLDVVLHGWFELGIAAAAYTHVAAAYPEITRAFDYTLHLYDDVIETDQLKLADGMLRVPQGDGIGVTLDKQRMSKLTIDETIVGA